MLGEDDADVPGSDHQDADQQQIQPVAAQPGKFRALKETNAEQHEPGDREAEPRKENRRKRLDRDSDREVGRAQTKQTTANAV